MEPIALVNIEKNERLGPIDCRGLTLFFMRFSVGSAETGMTHVKSARILAHQSALQFLRDGI
jgi:hypothetical protein